MKPSERIAQIALERNRLFYPTTNHYTVELRDVIEYLDEREEGSAAGVALVQVDDAIKVAARELACALYLYKGHKVDGRGPYGCITRALEAIHPNALKIAEEHGWERAYRDLNDEDDGETA